MPVGWSDHNMEALESFAHGAELRARIKANADCLGVQQHKDNKLKRAAVAIVVAPHGEEAAVLVTRRPHTMREHGGQWALPGGRIDAGETAVQSALRELHEELNLELRRDSVLGVLDDYVTRSGYIITPVVVWSESAWQDLQPNPDEVALIAPFSFSELARSDSPILHTIAQSDRPVLAMHYDGNVMFAPTGALLYQFREVALLGRETRVMHFEQPLFAWK